MPNLVKHTIAISLSVLFLVAGLGFKKLYHREFFPELNGPAFNGAEGSDTEGVTSHRLMIEVTTDSGEVAITNHELFSTIYPSSRGKLTSRCFPRKEGNIIEDESVIAYLDLMAQRSLSDESAKVVGATWYEERRLNENLAEVVSRVLTFKTQIIRGVDD